MVRRNIGLKSALLTASVDERIRKELQNNAAVKNVLNDETFWNDSLGVVCILKPICTAIEYCEGDSVSLSVMPRIWKHVKMKLDRASLELYGFFTDVIDEVMNAVHCRKEMNIRPVTLAADLLDPRFYGEHLSEDECTVDIQTVLQIAEHDMINRKDILNDLTEYRAKSGPVFGSDITWEAVNTASCSNNPQTWWLSVKVLEWLNWMHTFALVPVIIFELTA